MMFLLVILVSTHSQCDKTLTEQKLMKECESKWCDIELVVVGVRTSTMTCGNLQLVVHSDKASRCDEL